MSNTMLAEKAQITREQYSDSPGEIEATVAACEHDGRSHEEKVLRLFSEARTVFVRSLPYLAQTRHRAGAIDTDTTGGCRIYESLNYARQKLTQFSQAFDKHPDVYRRLETQLKAIVQATAKDGKNGSPRRRVLA